MLLTLGLSSGMVWASTKPDPTSVQGLTDLISDENSSVAQVLDYLKQHPVPADGVNTVGLTPMAEAIVRKREDIFRALFDHYGRPSLNTRISEELKMYTLYDYILQSSSIELIDFAKSVGGRKNPKSGQTDLFSVVLNDISVVKEFLRRGEKINVHDKDGNTPFMEAAGFTASNETLQLLIDNHAEIEARNKRGETAIFQSVFYWKIEKIKMLVAAHANINARDNDGNTPLLKLSSSFYDTDIQPDFYSQTFETLMDLGADINARDKEGNTVLNKSGVHSVNMIRLALRYHADPNAHNNDDETPLIRLTLEMTRDSDDTRALQELLSAHIDVNARNKFGATALTRCALSCSPTFVQALLDAGADKCIRSQDGNAAEQAINYERWDLVSLVTSTKCPPRPRKDVIIIN